MKQIFTERDKEVQEFEKEVPPPDYMVLAILSSLFCLPLGVVSIVKASKVNPKWNSGDYEGAWKMSDSARKWGLISIIVGVMFAVVFFTLYYTIFAKALRT